MPDYAGPGCNILIFVVAVMGQHYLSLTNNMMLIIHAELSSLLVQAKEQADLEQERREEEERRAHVRPWDRGKGTQRTHNNDMCQEYIIKKGREY